MMLSENQLLYSHEVSENLTQTELSVLDPKFIPTTTTIFDAEEATVIGSKDSAVLLLLLLLLTADILITALSTETADKLPLTPAAVTTTLRLSRINGKSLEDICVFDSHTVASAEDDNVMRDRKLLSHKPNPAPATVMSEADVVAEVDTLFTIPF